MSLNLETIRKAYLHPPKEDAFDHIPTREEKFATSERQWVDLCMEFGRDPKERRRGEHGSLIGGPEKPCSFMKGGLPMERSAEPRLAPLSWFTHEDAITPWWPEARNGDHLFIGHLICGFMAGRRRECRPTPHELYHAMLKENPSKLDRANTYAIFVCIRRIEIRSFLSKEGFSIYELVRTMGFSGCERGDLFDWANQFARKPK